MELDEKESEMSNRVTPDREFHPKEMDGNYHQNDETAPVVIDGCQREPATLRNYGDLEKAFDSE